MNVSVNPVTLGAPVFPPQSNHGTSVVPVKSLWFHFKWVHSHGISYDQALSCSHWLCYLAHLVSAGSDQSSPWGTLLILYCIDSIKCWKHSSGLLGGIDEMTSHSGCRFCRLRTHDNNLQLDHIPKGLCWILIWSLWRPLECSQHIANVQVVILRSRVLWIAIYLDGWWHHAMSHWGRKIMDVVRSLRLCVAVMLIGIRSPKSQRKHWSDITAEMTANSLGTVWLQPSEYHSRTK